MKKNKIVPSLWFWTQGGGISKTIEYYKNIFGNNFQAGQIIPLGNTPSGNSEICEVHLFGQLFSFMSTAKEHHPLNDAMSLVIHCEGQDEIDRYWNYFTQEGDESHCGWCVDKYGLRWQVLPENFEELMSRPNSFEVMMNQKKIVIEEY